MQLEDIFLARFADLTPDGLFTAVGGGMNRINAGWFPWTWGVLFLVARVRLTVEEAQAQHTAAVERETPYGPIEPIGPESPMMPLPSTAESGPDGKFGLSCNFCLMNLFFPQAGIYKYRLKIDGQEMGLAELLVAGPRPKETRTDEPNQ
jgi:hypothetical protein